MTIAAVAAEDRVSCGAIAVKRAKKSLGQAYKEHLGGN